jgi:hypothetical protein
LNPARNSLSWFYGGGSPFSHLLTRFKCRCPKRYEPQHCRFVIIIFQ